MTGLQIYSQNEISYEEFETRGEIEESPKSPHKRLSQFIIATCMLLTTIIFSQTPMVQRTFFYPLHYRESIDTYSARFNVDRNLAAAVIKNESNFDRRATSYVGAIGLMQLMPETAAWISTQLDEDEFDAMNLYESDANIRYGIWYLATLKDEFDGNDILAIAAYNAGSGNVRGWIEDYHWAEDFSDISAIPFPETRAFVRKVLDARSKYHELY